MKIVLSNIIALLTLSLMFYGCGGGGSSDSTSNEMSGQFIDAPVEGLSYECSSELSGTTDAEGRFTCNTGDNITFKVGDLTLGSCIVDVVVTPLHLYTNANDIEAAYNVAQLLHSLDNDANPDNGIKLSTEISLDNINIEDNSNTFQNALSSALASAGKTLYNREQAKAKMFSYIDAHSEDNYKLSLNIQNELELLENLMCNSSEKLLLGECDEKNCQDDAYECPTCTINEDLVYGANGSANCIQKSCEAGFTLVNGQCIVDDVPTVDEPLTLSSNSFTDGGVIPREYACSAKGGENISPQFNWSEVPEETVKLAIIMDDETSPCGTGNSACVHWGVFNIPQDISSLSQDVDTSTISNVSEGNTYNGTSNYSGPCPPSNHTYKITIYALDSEMPDISTSDTTGTGIRRSQFESNYGDYILDSNTISATFAP